jgi:hypothetical protein
MEALPATLVGRDAEGIRHFITPAPQHILSAEVQQAAQVRLAWVLSQAGGPQLPLPPTVCCCRRCGARTQHPRTDTCRAVPCCAVLCCAARCVLRRASLWLWRSACACARWRLLMALCTPTLGS